MTKRLLFGIPICLIVVWITWTQILVGVRGSEEEAVSAEAAATQAEASALQPPVFADTSGYEPILAEYERLPMGVRWGSEEQAHRWMLQWAVDRLEPCVSVTGLSLKAEGPKYPESGDWAAFSISVDLAPMDRESGRLIFSNLREQAASGQGMRLVSFEWVSSPSEMRLSDPDTEGEDVNGQSNQEGEGTAGTDDDAREDEWHWDCVENRQVEGLLNIEGDPACKLERVIPDPDRSLLAALRPERFINPPEELREPPPQPAPVVALGSGDAAGDEAGDAAAVGDWGCVSLVWTYEQIVRLPPLEVDEATESADAA